MEENLILPLKYVGKEERKIILYQEKEFTGNFWDMELTRQLIPNINKTRILIKPIINTKNIYEDENILFHKFTCNSVLRNLNISSICLKIKGIQNNSIESNFIGKLSRIDLYCNDYFICDFIDKYNNVYYFPNIKSEYNNSIPSQFCFYVDFKFVFFFEENTLNYPIHDIEKSLVIQINNDIGDIFTKYKNESPLEFKINFESNKYNDKIIINRGILQPFIRSIPEKRLNKIPDSKIIEIDMKDSNLSTKEIIEKYNVEFN